MKKNQKIQMVEIMMFLTLLTTTLIKCTQSSPYSINTNPFLPPGNLTASPLGNLTSSTACHLDLSSELFGGVSAACSSSPLSLTRCCPVLAAWLFAAHATSALAAVPPSTNHPASSDDGPMVPENESQKCVDKLEESLKSKNIKWTPRVNDTCDTVLCYCGIRLHQISSLSCPVNMFNVTAGGDGDNNKKNGSVKLVRPMGGVKEMERECKNASFFGCSRCLHSLQKLKGEGKGRGGGERAKKMFDRDCQLMGLTWLLAKNKSLYIPTVSAVLRAVLYSSSHAKGEESSYKCSPDQENMPLAVDSLQFQHMLDSTTSSSSSSSSSLCLATLHVMLLLLVGLF